MYDLTIFKLHCGKLTLKIYTKGERVLRIEAIAHNTQQLDCGRSLEKFPEIVSRLKGMLERFADALSCIDQCFIADRNARASASSIAGRQNQSWWNRSQQEAHALGRRGGDCLVRRHPTASRPPSWRIGSRHSASTADRSTARRRAAYDLKKLRGKQIVRRVGRTRRYEPLPTGLKAITALVVLRNKAIKPLLAAAQRLRPSRGAHNPRALDAALRRHPVAMQGVFHELGIAA